MKTKVTMRDVGDVKIVELYGKMAQVATTLEEALAIANRAVTKEDLICITGSLYLVGEAKKHFTALEKLKQQQQLALQHASN